MFTFLCTLYHLISDEDEALSDKDNKHLSVIMTTTVYKLHFFGDMNVSPSTVFFIWSCLIFVLAIHMSKEFFQMITYGKRNYFSSIDNWFQLTALFITLASLVPYLPHKLQISIGSFSILFAWICMSLFFQDLELLSLGKYIVAFR